MGHQIQKCHYILLSNQVINSRIKYAADMQNSETTLLLASTILRKKLP